MNSVVDGSVRFETELVEEQDAIQAELHASPYPALRRVRCCVSDGRIVLCGGVPSYYLKQMAQGLLLRRLGTEFPVENRLKVVPTAAPCWCAD